MSIDDDGLPASWEEIKRASGRLGRREDEAKVEKRLAREYLSQADCEDDRAEEQLAIPGYN
jgi:hypothetical protein